MSTLLTDLDRLAEPRHDWTRDEVAALHDAPFNDLIFAAQSLHRRVHRPNTVQKSRLLSIKTGGCAEDCGYCNQSAHFDTGLKASKLMDPEEVEKKAIEAKNSGATRFCMGAAWREVADGPEFERVLEMVRGVKEMGLETCVTLGMLEPHQARRLRDAGLDFYNHNLDTGRSFYDQVVTTREYDDRLRTIAAVREAGVHVCTGGILGMGEDRGGRAELLAELASLDPPPESVPINTLVGVEGTPLADTPALDWSELVRTVAAARILMPRAWIRLSAGRREMSEEAQALCFLAGANSLFSGEDLLTTPNAEPGSDQVLLEKLGLARVET